MFIDPKQAPPSLMPEVPAPHSLLGRKEIIIVVGIALIIVIGAGAWWYLTKYKAASIAQTPVQEETPKSSELPGTLNEATENNGGGTEAENPDLKGENVTFGAFYKSLNEPLTPKISGVKLPLNVKSEVSNYYDTARKLNLDPVIANLNQDGFATLENPYSKVTNDFLGTYFELNQRSVPLVVTGDFLLYYYQNSLKQIYKDIEASFFYDSLWRITNNLYQTANGRYQERRAKVGVAPDSLLESERLEAAYFAVALSLLSPEPEQINSTEDLNNTKKFKPSEAKNFEFTVPDYLGNDLSAEISLIQGAKQNVKSPVLLYKRDYAEFKVPAEYNGTAKLRNFYLASRWYGSLFPLYFKDQTCNTCLLDREDWIINQGAAHLIARDLSADQSLKNEWAKIYKVISYFSGLRSELTYLHFDKVRQESFPKSSLEDVLNTEGFNHLATLRDNLAGLQFNPAEGSLSRSKASDKPLLGLRLLQTAYWPSQSFYEQLTYDPVGNHNQPLISPKNRAKYFTACNGENDNLYRCRGLGFDVIAPLLKDKITSKFLLDNTNYQRYAEQTDVLRQKLNNFDTVTWHNNNFWTTLNTASAFVNEKFAALPYTNSTRWLERKISSTLAALTNLSLPADTWRVARERSSGSLETGGGASSLNYIEPNEQLANELLANTDMLFKALISLGVVKDNDVRFSDLQNKMSVSRAIIRKELGGVALSGEDYQFISDFISQYRIETSATKTNSVNFFNPKTNSLLRSNQSIGPLKLLLLIYNKDGKAILAIGPVFNYKEQ